jgi:ATP-dependent Clp protease ATP-binding subunit ClpX
VNRCSFCDKAETEVKRLITGPDVAICDACVDLCVEILDDPVAGTTTPIHSSREQSPLPAPPPPRSDR